MNDIFVAQKHTKKEIEAEKTPEDVKMLSTFCRNPKGVSFQTQKTDESILLFLRAHLATNFPWVFTISLLAFLPIVILVLSPVLEINIFPSPNIARFAVVYILFYYLILFSYSFINLLQWFYNVFMVTSKQVVDIDYSDIVIHHIAVTNLNQIQDAKYTQSGFIPTFFNYGNIFIQTAGTQSNFQESSVPKPREATHIIGDIIGKDPLEIQEKQKWT